MNAVKEKLQGGSTVIGTWSILPSPHLIDVLSRTGLDFIIFDREHGPASHETISTLIPPCHLHGMTPFIRIPEISYQEVQKALDVGAQGIHVPNISSATEVERLIELAKYPPIGKRGLSPYTPANGYTADHLSEKIQLANQNLILTIHLEGKQALQHIEDFFAFDYIDVIFIGRYDLSSSLGIPGQINHDKVINALSRVVELGERAGVTIGSIANTPDDLDLLIDLRVPYITYSGDCSVIFESYSTILQRARKGALHGIES